MCRVYCSKKFGDLAKDIPRALVHVTRQLDLYLASCLVSLVTIITALPISGIVITMFH